MAIGTPGSVYRPQTCNPRKPLRNPKPYDLLKHYELMFMKPWPSLALPGHLSEGRGWQGLSQSAVTGVPGTANTLKLAIIPSRHRHTRSLAMFYDIAVEGLDAGAQLALVSGPMYGGVGLAGLLV